MSFISHLHWLPPPVNVTTLCRYFCSLLLALFYFLSISHIICIRSLIHFICCVSFISCPLSAIFVRTEFFFITCSVTSCNWSCQNTFRYLIFTDHSTSYTRQATARIERFGHNMFIVLQYSNLYYFSAGVVSPWAKTGLAVARRFLLLLFCLFTSLFFLCFSNKSTDPSGLGLNKVVVRFFEIWSLGMRFLCCFIELRGHV